MSLHVRAADADGAGGTVPAIDALPQGAARTGVNEPAARR